MSQKTLSTTITDELRMATNSKGKAIDWSIKDRGAIPPAGHLFLGNFGIAQQVHLFQVRLLWCKPVKSVMNQTKKKGIRTTLIKV
jgi:hypothetical protein